MKTLKYTSTLIAVADMEKSKKFYHDVLGLEVVADFGDNGVHCDVKEERTVWDWTGQERKPDLILPYRT